MNADRLRTLQAPLKERYREDASAARITLRAQGRLGKGVGCRLETDAPQEQLDTLLRLTERYCVVFQTLARPPRLAFDQQRAA